MITDSFLKENLKEQIKTIIILIGKDIVNFEKVLISGFILTCRQVLLNYKLLTVIIP
jgi:hypothetical protein